MDQYKGNKSCQTANFASQAALGPRWLGKSYSSRNSQTIMDYAPPRSALAGETRGIAATDLAGVKSLLKCV